MPVAVRQFNEGVSQAEVEHEANIISSFNKAKPFMLLLQFTSTVARPDRKVRFVLGNLFDT